MSELDDAIAYIVATCKADTALMAVATGGVFESDAPIGVALPYVQITSQSPGVDSLSGNRVRLMSRALLQIKVVGYADQGAYADLVTGANRIDALFKHVENATGTVLACYREQTIFYPDPKLVNGRPVRHKGGLYSFEIQAS